jgi:N-acetylmuramoyl-L-alanine amidase
MRYFLDPGHGAQDSGCVANGIEEKTVNLSVALKLKPLLIAAGLEVKLSREDDSFPSLNERPAMANSWGADYFMSIHHNGGGGIGYEIYRSIRPDASLAMAQAIAAQYEKIGRKPHNGGVQERKGSDGLDYYAVIRQSHMPAILSEFCYLDSSDVSAIDSQSVQQAEAQAIASGIFAHLGISPVQPIKTPVQPVATSNPAVKTIQHDMNRLKIVSPTLIEDGISGDKTKAAIKKFQSIVGIPQTGVYGSQSDKAYQSIVIKTTLKQGSKGVPARYIQFRIGVAIDGVFGPKTAVAVEVWQRQNGLSADGICGAHMWAKLIG